MHTPLVHRSRIAPKASTASAIASLVIHDYAGDMPRVAIPRPEIHLVVRFGAAAHRGLDVHALGVRERAIRKVMRNGQRALVARLRLGAHRAVLGVPASALVGRAVALADLWGDAATERLLGRLADAESSAEAADVLDDAIADRLSVANVNLDSLALRAAHRLEVDNVSVVAADLDVSERHLRRVFRDTLGLTPKTFAKLARFHRALRAAHTEPNWANIAAEAGYYDQAHLIAEFRALAGVTPRVLLSELRLAI